MLKKILLLAVAGGWGSGVDAGQHVHGEGKLMISQDGSQWQVQFVLPAADVLGFEHAPESPKQQAVVDRLAGRLGENDQVVTLNGQCRLDGFSHSLPTRAVCKGAIPRRAGA